MFREMRRIKQQITFEECQEILKRASSGVLGLYGDDGYPYTVPLSFVYEEGADGGLGTIGFHTEEELRRSANAVGAKYSRGFEDLYMEETEDTIRRGTLCCVEITIDHMTGKIGRMLLMERQKGE